MALTSLKLRVLKGAFWTIGGNTISQILRLGGNLILTRLLFPEAFGLMVLVQVFIVGIAMLSDIGINASIIQNKRSDPKFLNTAWTLQVVRGLVLWLLICAISWPVSLFYEEPLLVPLLIVSGLSSIVIGFQSTKIIIANRKVELRKLTITEISSSLVGLIFMIIGAWITQSIWALVIGGLTQSLVKVVMSYSYFKGANNYFYWDSDAFKSIYKFGRWLMLSSIMSFFAAQGDRLIIGRVFDVGFLGIYSISMALVAAVYMLVQKLSSVVFFPSFSELVRDRPGSLYGALRKARFAQIILLWPIAVLLVFWGEELIYFLYDDRYSEAGWMLEVLSLGMLIGVLRGSYAGVLMALGKTGISTLLLGVQVCIKLSAMLIGSHLGGQIGMIFGLAFASSIIYPVDIFVYSRFSLWQPELDIPVIIMSVAVIIVYVSRIL